jgi:hypothetical protein
MARDGLLALHKRHQCPRLLSPGEVRIGLAQHTAVGLMGNNGEDTRTRVAALGEVMGVAPWRSTARGNGMPIKAECRHFGQQQRGQLRSHPATTRC